MNSLPAPGPLAQALLDGLSAIVLVVDLEGRIRLVNRSAARYLGEQPERLLMRRGGEALHCLYEHQSAEGCGSTAFCRDCAIRNAMTAAAQRGTTVRDRHNLAVERDGKTREVAFIVSATPLTLDGETFVVLMLEDMTDVEALREILPICSSCKRIRDDANFWERVEEYFAKHTDIGFTHGLCPDCVTTLYPDLIEEIEGKQPATIGAMHDAGTPNTEIARFLGVTEGAVRYHLRRQASGERPGRGRRPIARAYDDVIRRWIERHRGEAGSNLARLHDWLVAEHGYPGSLRSLQRYIANTARTEPRGVGEDRDNSSSSASGPLGGDA